MLNYEIAKFSLNEIHMYNKNIFINMQLLIFVHVYWRQFMVEKKCVIEKSLHIVNVII